MIRPGQAWGGPSGGPPDASGTGGDRELAALAAAHPGARLAFEPDGRCELAAAVGLRGPSAGATELVVDALELHGTGLAVNMVIAGVPPERVQRWTRAPWVVVRVDGRPVFAGMATTVVLANGQFRRGVDLVPRGHPGDGRLEVKVYALRPGERAAMRRRLPAGGHLPHPRIVTATGRRAEVAWNAPAPLEVDGHRVAPQAKVDVTIRSPAFVLLV